MYICINNNCWFTNIGEAFIDIGLKKLMTNVTNNEKKFKLGCVSPMSTMYLPKEARVRAHFNGNLFKPDLLLFGGMYATSQMFNLNDLLAEFRFAKSVKENGGQIAFVGLGGINYDSKEREDVLKGLEVLQPLFITTRDKLTYDLYSDYFECKKGLDCAFWVNEEFNPTGMRCEKYVVSTFNRSDEPTEVGQIKGAVHPWHMQYSLNTRFTKYLAKSNLFVSDSPFEYLTLYANASKVYTDLVHAVVPSLIYQTPVKYWKVDMRRNAFEHLEYVKTDFDGFMYLDNEKLTTEKKEIENYIKKKLNGLN